jgi:hypothetical protein
MRWRGHNKGDQSQVEKRVVIFLISTDFDSDGCACHFAGEIDGRTTWLA